MPKLIKQENALRTQEDLEKIAALFSRNLLQNPEALAYLEGRGLGIDLVKSGLIGFCPPYYDHWFDLIRGRITVPIRDIHNNILAFAGRQFEPMKDVTERAFWDSYGRDPAKAQKRFDKWLRGKWINEVGFSKGRHLYHLNEAIPFIRERKYMILVEGYFDVLNLREQGMPNISSVCGLALTEQHTAIIKRYCDHIVFILDPDDAGQKALEKMTVLAHESELIPHAVFLPSNYDPDEFVLKFGGNVLKTGIENMIANEKKELRIKIQ